MGDPFVLTSPSRGYANRPFWATEGRGTFTPKIRSLAGCSQTPSRLGSQPWIKLKVQISHWHLINSAIKRTIKSIYGSYF